MSDIDTSGIDENKPNQGNALTADVRANFSAIKNQFATAKTELGNLSGVTDAATARNNLGLSAIATQDPGSVAITGGSITGITDLALEDGGTGASTAADARTNLGLGTLATQDSDNVSIAGGTVGGTPVDELQGRIPSPTSGNLVSMDANGDMQDAGGSIDFTKNTSLAATAVSGSTLSGAMLAAGALVEWGSNANGEYWRWESGLQVCRTNSVSSTYGGSGNVTGTWTLPANFIDATYTGISVVANVDFAHAKGVPMVYAKTISDLKIDLRGPSGTFSSDATATMQAIAIGLWK